MFRLTAGFILLLALWGWFWPVSAVTEPLLLSLPPYANPTSVYNAYAPLGRYLSRNLERDVRLLLAPDYHAQIQSVRQGDVDIAILGPAPYILAALSSPGPVPLAKLVFADDAYDHVVFITHQDSPVDEIEEVFGKSFAFGDFGSFGSHFLPRRTLAAHGIELHDLRTYAFLSNHENILLAVLHKDFDAGAVRVDIFHKYQERALRVFHGPIAIPPHVVVCGDHLPQELQQALREILFSVYDEEVLRAINPLMVGFSPVDETEFEPAKFIIELYAP